MSALEEATSVALRIPSLTLTEVERTLADAIRSVADLRLSELENHVLADDGSELRPVFDALNREGILRANIPSRFGGDLDADLPSARRYCIIREALAEFSSVGDEIYVAHNLGLYPVLRWGWSEECVAAARKGCAGEYIFAFALTEPSAGSDPNGIECTAIPNGNGWTLNGRKRFISNAPGADAYVVFAHTGRPGLGRARTSAFLVLKSDLGFGEGVHLRMTAAHPIGEIWFDDLRIGQDRLLGQTGDGMMIALETLRIFRVSVAAQALGWMARARGLALDRANERYTFGRRLVEHYPIRRKIAEINRDLLGGRALVLLAASLADSSGGHDKGLSSSAAKTFVTEAAFRAAFETQQIWGAEGLVLGSRPESLLRETRQAITYEGPSEIQRKIIARRLGVDV